MKLALFNSPKKVNKKLPVKKIKHVNIVHPVNSVLTEIVSKKSFKSCGCGK